MINTQLILNTLLHLLPVVYALAFFNYLLVFITEDTMVRKLARPLLWTAVVLNFIYAAVYTIYLEHIPLVTVYQVLGAIAFSLAGLALWVEYRTGSPYSAPFILFIAGIFQIFNAEFPRFDHQVPDILHSKMFSLHVASGVVGYSAFAVAAVYGVLYLLLYRGMRAQNFGLFYKRLPPLGTLDQMNAIAATTGFVTLSIGVLIGFVWSRMEFGEFRLDPKVLTAVITLAVYGLALAAWRFRGGKGTRMAAASVVGFCIVLFSIFGVNFFLTEFHGFFG